MLGVITLPEECKSGAALFTRAPSVRQEVEGFPALVRRHLGPAGCASYNCASTRQGSATMSTQSPTLHDRSLQRIVFDDEDSDAPDSASIIGMHEAACNRLLHKAGLDRFLPIRLVGPRLRPCIELAVFGKNQRGATAPQLLIPIDARCRPDERRMEEMLTRSLGTMIADSETFRDVWLEVRRKLVPMFATRPQASLERLGFLAGGDRAPLLRAELMLVTNDLSTSRSGLTARDIDELVGLVAAAFRRHDANVAVIMENGRSPYETRMTSLTSTVLQLAGVSARDLFMRVDAEEGLGFRASCASLPFSFGRLRWSRGVLGCYLAMTDGRSWMDSDRVVIAAPGEFPASVLSSCIGKPLDTVLEVAGFAFDATIATIRKSGQALVVRIEMPTEPMA